MRLTSANIRWVLDRHGQVIPFWVVGTGGRCVMKTRFGRFVKCGLTVCIVALLAGCTESNSRPNPSPGVVASSSAPSKTASPTPSAEAVNLRGAERAVARFWRVIDRLSAEDRRNL